MWVWHVARGRGKKEVDQVSWPSLWTRFFSFDFFSFFLLLLYYSVLMLDSQMGT